MPPLSVVKLLLAEPGTLRLSVFEDYSRRVTFCAAGRSVTAGRTYGLLGGRIMKTKTFCLRNLNLALAATLVAGSLCFAPPARGQQKPDPVTNVETQAIRTPSRIIEAVDEKILLTLKGNVHPLARAEFDQGAVSDGLPLHRMLLLLQRSSSQEAALQKLLDDQQDKSSPNYHAWLTPTQFGQQFGPADADIQAVTNWLQSHGFQIAKVSAGRTLIEFSGTAGQVRSAFHTEIHNYMLQGQLHTANVSDPQIPAALAPVVAGPISLNNFPVKSHFHRVGTFQKSLKTGETKPLFSFPDCAPAFCYGLGPADFATIYNTAPLLSGTPKIDGTGQTIAIVGESNINAQDVIDFRNIFGLPQNFSSSNIILNGPDPGLNGSEGESDLDVQWAGAVAPGANIEFVTSAPTETTAGIFLSAVYIVENNLAGVMSESFGGCEQQIGTLNQFHNTLWEQAAAQGITVMVSAGDGGSAGCDNFDTAQTASRGLGVSGFASTPFNVAVGGTDFDQINTWNQFWSNSNTSTTQASALGYIPEIPWNDSCGQLGISGCASPQQGLLNIVAGSGGVSTIYGKPSWQSGTGVPADGHRDVPDVSLFASNGFDNSFYILCQIDVTTIGGSCNLSEFQYTFQGVGGTSASTPAFAGIMALVNQKQASVQNPAPRQGNANYVLYQLFKKQTNATPALNCNSSATASSACTFYDITHGNSALANGASGNNDVPCKAATTNCSTKTGSTNGVLVTTASPTTPAYSTTTGYDLATGLGSVNAANLVNNWGSVTFLPSTTTLSATVNGSSVTSISGITHGTPVSISSSVAAGQGATGTPSGQIALLATPNPATGIQSGNLGISEFSLTNGTATGTGVILPGGTYALTAHYQGDGTFGASDSRPGIPVTITSESSKTVISLPTFDPSTGSETGNAPPTLVYGSPYIGRVDIGNSALVRAFPSPASCTPPNCPTGSVSITDSYKGGAAVPLDAGTFPLNSSGYAEDLPIQLAGGAHLLTANYPGDSSFGASSGTYAVTVAPAPTITTIDTVDNVSVGTVGVPFGLNLTTRTNSSGAIPTGTYSVLDGGKPVTGTSNLSSGQTGTFSPGAAFVQGGFTFTFTTPGVHILTAGYSGDANYAPSTSAASYQVNVNNASSTTMTASSTNIIAGNQITLTATVDTSIKSPAPTNNVQFYGTADGYFAGTIKYAAITDASGNAALQATLAVSPNNTEQIWANFNGDATFASSSSFNTPVNVTVVTPDFSVSPTQLALTVTAGAPAVSTPILVTPATNLTSQVTFQVLQAVNYAPGMNCAVTPNPVSLSGQLATTASLGCSLPAPSSSTTTSVLLPLPVPGANPDGNLWLVGGVSFLLGLIFLALPSRFRIRRLSYMAFATCLIAAIIGCGGGGESIGGGGTPPPPPPTPTSVSLSVTGTKVASGANLVTTVTVTGTQSPGGTVTILDSTTGIGLNSQPLVSGQAQLPVSFGGVGAHNLVAKYSGDSKNQASQTQSPMVIVVTGTTQGVFLTAGTGSDIKQLNLSLTVQ